MKRTLNYILPAVRGTLRAYPQIFFSDSIVFGILLLFVSFFDYVAGVSGLIVALSANISALAFGLDSKKTDTGLYAFNALLVGLGAGMMFEPSVSLFVLLAFTGLLCFALTVAFDGILSKYRLPYLSIPFMLTLWMVILASRDYTGLVISERSVYFYNYLYNIGGQDLVDFYQSTQAWNLPTGISTFFISLGAVFFQPSVFGGLLIAIALLLVSRISFMMSLAGFFSAMITYNVFGSDFYSLSYTHIGFNFILTSIALGGFYVIPSWRSLLLVVIVTPVNVLATHAFTELLLPWQLPLFSMSFNFIVISFLYILKFRTRFTNLLPEVAVQEFSPEKNLYSYKNYVKRFSGNSQYFPLRLPFWGDWVVEQGHNGKITHTDEYRFAFDFVIRDNKGNTFTGDGRKCENFFCYKKTVLSPGYGKVVKIIDGLPDNEIGKPDIENNWGNCIIIKHNEYLYSKLCHLMPGSFKVEEGDFVASGQMVALVGNSGRSPEPHLHMQLQTTPWMNSGTIYYPFSHYVKRKDNRVDLCDYSVPAEKDVVSHPETCVLLAKTLEMIPGRKMVFEVNRNGKTSNEIWKVHTDSLNNMFLSSESDGSSIRLSNDGLVHYSHFYSGSHKKFMYLFYLATYRVYTGFYKGLTINDSVNLRQVFTHWQLFLHDIIAPFYTLLHADFVMEYCSIDNELSPGVVELKGKVELRLGKIKLREISFEIKAEENRFGSIKVKNGSSIINAYQKF